MMYNNKLVCSVKVGNKILREKNQNNQSVVYVPFGSEYTLIVKNLAGRSARVDLEIDGKKVSENGILFKAGKESELKGFIDGYVAKRAFKFIQKTQEISDFRGDKIDDGMIRVTWQFEKEKPITVDHYEIYHKRNWIYCHRCMRCHYDDESCHIWAYPVSPWIRPNHLITRKYEPTITYGSGSGTSNIGCGGTQSSSFIGSVTNCNSDSSFGRSIDSRNFFKSSEVNNDEGITVEGSKVDQQFGKAYLGDLEQNIHSMVIILKGYHGSELVKKAITVKHKKQCSSCGRRWKNMEFCPNCGTVLR